MKRLFFTILFCSTIFISVPQAVANRALKVVSDLDHKKGKIGTYRALVIGIQNYDDPKIPDLQTPLNDAKAISDVLQTRYGFEVETLLDHAATKKAMYDSFRDLSSRSKAEDSVLIYYAGHGDFDKQYDDGWWIPVDAKGGDPVTYLDNVQIQKAMRSMKAKHVLLISDSCYSGTLFGQAREMPLVINDKYYLSLYNEKSRWGMTSGNKTPVSDSGTGGHSVFAYQLIKKLKNNDKPFISTQEIYINIAPIIANNSEQTPLCRPIKGAGDQGGEFIFITTASTNQYQPKKISASQVPAPESKKISFDDIIKAGEKQAEIKKQWADWQSDREDEYSQVKRLDENTSLDASQKEEAWLRFSSGVSQDNPFSNRDDDMRAYAGQRISYFENRSSIKKEVANPKGKIEQKKQSATLASIDTADKKARIIAREGRYEKHENGIVYDKNTGLEWIAGPDKATGWYSAKAWISSLSVAGEGWRMPTNKELKTLYNPNDEINKITPLFNMSQSHVWQKESAVLLIVAV
ncbi:MAG: caspase family protein [Proteobacteria bacterium]|nr:caspase family protein [Pseudomonadota bacterium]MBU1586087.1 caspase family protein [Pseudomonadota bacterium]